MPSLYAGSGLDSAIYETIFHDVPVKATLKTVRKQAVLSRTHTELEVQRPLKLVKLFMPELKRWGISRQQLIASSASHYRATAQWAETIHHNYPQADGLVWTSNQCDPERACLFFGDRVVPTDFAIIQLRDGATDSSFLADVRSAGKRAGIVITL